MDAPYRVASRRLQCSTMEEDIPLRREPAEQKLAYEMDCVQFPETPELYSPSLLADTMCDDFGKDRSDHEGPRRWGFADGKRSSRNQRSSRQKSGSHKWMSDRTWTKLSESFDGSLRVEKSAIILGMDFVKRKTAAARQGIQRSAKSPESPTLVQTTQAKTASFIMQLLAKKTKPTESSDTDDATKSGSDDEDQFPLPNSEVQSRAPNDATISGSRTTKNEQYLDNFPTGTSHRPFQNNKVHNDDEIRTPAPENEEKKFNRGSNNRFFLNPPIFEIQQKDRRLSSDLSDISSLTGSNQLPLEFSLETGFADRSSQLIAMSENIARSLKRVETKAAASPSKCSILLMNPSRNIFEIIQVPFERETTTVGEVLDKIPKFASDKRLAKMRFCGLSHEGIYVTAASVPVKVLGDTQSSGKAMFAVPSGYTSEQIDAMGIALLRIPQVTKLLKDQQAKLDVPNAISMPRASLANPS